MGFAVMHRLRKKQNITIRKNRITAASTQIDVKTAKAALFPQSFVLYQPAGGESSVSGDE